MNPLVSIITPAYNAAEFLGETLGSIRSQSYENWELVIVDDASTDGTWEMIEGAAMEEPRIRAFRNESNRGVVFTRNRALDEAKGRFVAFLDSDDLWEPLKLEKQVAFMLSGSHAFTYTSYENFYEDGRSKVFNAVPFMTAKDNIKNTAIGILTVMIDREAVGEFHMPDLEHGEDTATWQLILERGFTACGISEVLSHYRVRGTSLSGNKLSAARKKWHVYRDYYHFSIPKSAYYFICYAFNALKRRMG